MSGMHSKNKGKSGESEVRDLFRELLRGVVDDVEEIRRNHQQAEIGGSDLVGVPFLSVEIKRVKKLPGEGGMIDWWGQTCGQAMREGKEPCLIFRQDNGKWHVMLWIHPYGACADQPWFVGTLTWNTFADYFKARVTSSA